MINIKGQNKALVLAALYNNSRPLGMGFLQFDPKPMSETEAKEWLTNYGKRPYFDYLKGRVMKVEIHGDTLDPRLYDRDNGEGAAERALRTYDLITE